MFRHVSLLIVLSMLIAGGLACAEGTALPELKSEPGKTAATKYQDAVAAAKKQYDEQLAAAKTTLIADLDKALAEATKAGDLDEALRIREAKKGIETEDAAKPSALHEGAIRFGKSQYRIILADVRWSEAREACRKLGGDLASIDTDEKREFLKSQIGSLQLWVGGHYNSRTKRWQWPNGKSISSDAWGPGRPENNGPYTVLFPGSGLIGDGKEELPDCKGYICEWTR